ncbi:hypothetical protein [Hyphomicrobium sp.]|jgi:hypothetical protein|uniref:hypothetical protein n=1 Tax=Hyphomicrobium sp. TaxID=82 RepID=UPI002FE14D62
MLRTARLALCALIAAWAWQAGMGEVRAGAAAEPDTATEAAGDRDVMFGHQDIGTGLDHAVIEVGRDIGKFDRIRLRAIGNAIHVHALRIQFDDGTQRHIPVAADIEANAHSDWFDIDEGRFIRAIELAYRPEPGARGGTRVEVTGEYAKGWLAAAGEGRTYHQGWMLLGAQTAGFTGFDRDIIRVGANEGGFSRLRIEAVDRAITLKEIRVKFASGPDEVFAMRARVDPGKPYGPLEFKGGKAPITSIVATYRSRFDLRKGLKSALNGRPAVVQIWGQH